MNSRQPSGNLGKLLIIAVTFIASAAFAESAQEQQDRLAYEQNTIDVVSNVSRSVVAVRISGANARQAGSWRGQLPSGSGFVVDDECVGQHVKQREVLRHGEGDQVTLTLWRDGETHQVEVPLEVVQPGN